MNPRFGAALRFGLTLGVVNLGALWLFGSGAAATAASFAVIGSLYFLDYDGTTVQRMSAFGLSTLVGLAGVCVGALAALSLPSSVIAAFLIGLGFWLARAFRGLVARSFIGGQLAFVLTIFTSHASEQLPQLLLGWAFGSVAALVAALVLFPRQHSGALRRALSNWCLAAAELLRSTPTNRAAARATLDQRRAELDALDPTESIAGLWGRHTRALASMRLQVDEFSGYLQLAESVFDTGAPLAQQVAEAFTRAGELVLPAAAQQPLIQLQSARDDDLTQAVQRFGHDRQGDAAQAERSAQAHLGIRVSSLVAESLQVGAADSHGWPHANWSLGFEPEHRVRDLAARTVRHDSVWLRTGLRSGLALAGATLIALLMGLEHGVWVVMTTLAVINLAASARDTSRGVLWNVLGVLAGVAVSAAIITVARDWWMLAGLVPLLAVLAKWWLPAGGFIAQASYTPLAVVNVAMLSWPTPHGLDVVRVEDILIGAVVALVATVLTFPFGMRRLLDRSWLSAQQAAEQALTATRSWLDAGIPVPPALVLNQQREFAAHTDAVDAVLAGQHQLDTEQRLSTERERWLVLAVLCQIGVAELGNQAHQSNAAELTGLMQVWADEAFAELQQALPAS